MTFQQPTVVATHACTIDEVCTENGAPLAVVVTFEQLSDGTVRVTLDVADGYSADLRGFFFDVYNNSILSHLVMANPTTDNVVSPNDPPGPTPADADGLFISTTDSLVGTGGDNNMNGCIHDGSQVTFEAGVEFGAPGAGQDKLETASYTLKLDNGNPLTLADLIGLNVENGEVEMGIRATSVGDDPNNLGSSKLFGTCGGPEANAIISGSKFADADGIIGAGQTGDETPIPGWTIYIDTNDNGVLDWTDGNNNDVWDAGEGERWTTTDQNGDYSFDHLAAGTYIIREVVPDGWTQLSPDDKYTVTVAADGSEGGKDFVNFELINVSGYKWVDTNGDGVWDAGEPGKEGWTIYLDSDNDLSNGVLDSTTTDSNGKYEFKDLGPGHYYVYEASDAAWTNTFDGATDFDAQSGVDVGGDTGVAENFNFGNFELINVSGYKWVDTNGDGVWDAGEPGKEGWTIYLDSDNDLSNGVLDSTTTDSNGKYEFKDLGPGHYYVYEASDAAWTNTFDGATDFDAQSGVDVGGDTGVAENFNFGNFEDIHLSGFKWHDSDGSKTWNGTEAGLDNWTIYLDTDNDLSNGYLASTTSAFDGTHHGAYSFDVSLDDILAFDPDATTLYVYEGSQDHWLQNYGGYSIDIESGATVTGDYGQTEDGNFGNEQELCFSGLTRGAWGTPNDGAGTWNACYKTTDLWETVFFGAEKSQISFTDGTGKKAVTYNDAKLLDTLLFNGGGANQLAAQATAALLNASEWEKLGTSSDDLLHPYRFSSTDIKNAVQFVYGLHDGISTNDYKYDAARGEALKTLLDYWNNAESELCAPEHQAGGTIFDVLGWHYV